MRTITHKNMALLGIQIWNTIETTKKKNFRYDEITKMKLMKTILKNI